MDIAVEMVGLPQQAQRPDKQLGRVIRVADHARAEEQPFNIVAVIKLDGQAGQLLGQEGRPHMVIRTAVRAIGTVILAGIGQQDLEQRNAAPVFGPGMADAAQAGIADPLPVVGPFDAAGRTRHVITGRFTQDGQFLHQIHHHHHSHHYNGIGLPCQTYVRDNRYDRNDTSLPRKFMYSGFNIVSSFLPCTKSVKIRRLPFNKLSNA